MATTALLSVLLALAQDWQAVQQLPPNSQIRVTTTKRQTARLIQSTPDAVTIKTPTGEQTIQKSEIKRIELRKGRSRARRAAIGAAAGAAAGTAVSAIAIAAASDDAEGPDTSIAVLILLGAGLYAAGGAAIGALWPSSYQVVYAQ